MQFNKNSSLARNNILRFVIKSILGLGIILGLVYFLNSIDFPAPKKKIENIIPNENFKIVK